jgi:AraC-like DNA-binding protein
MPVLDTIFLGTHLMDPELPLSVLHSVHHGPMEPHTHDFHELVYIRRGRGIHHINGHPYPIITGDLYLMQPGEFHRYETHAEPIEIINIIFYSSLFATADWVEVEAMPSLAPFFQPHTRERHKITLGPPNDHLVETLCERIRSELLRRPPGYRLLCRSLALELLLSIGRAAQGQDDGHAAGPIATVIAYLHAHPEEPVTMGDLAAETGLSANYLGERFHAETGATVADYLNRLRIDRARELLAGSTRSVTDIALSTGFDGASYFGKVFRRLTGHTPRAYRRLARGS